MTLIMNVASISINTCCGALFFLSVLLFFGQTNKWFVRRTSSRGLVLIRLSRAINFVIMTLMDIVKLIISLIQGQTGASF